MRRVAFAAASAPRISHNDESTGQVPKGTFKMKNLIGICGAAMIAAVIAAPASAQVAGVYAGTSADGQNISFTVGTDPNTGDLALISAGISFSAPCRGDTGFVLNTSWGFGLTADITNGEVQVTQIDNYFYFQFALKFSADGQSAAGKILSISPTLYPLTNPPPKAWPTSALFCVSPEQTMSLTLQPASDAVSVKVNQQSVRQNVDAKTVKADATK
jgi:hypothetical protein